MSHPSASRIERRRRTAGTRFERLQATRNTATSIAVALAFAVLSIALSLLAEPLFDPYPFLILYPAMVLIGLLGGPWGSLAGLAIVWPACLYFFLPVNVEWGFGDEGSGRVIRLLILLASLLAIGVLLRRREVDRLQYIRRERDTLRRIERSERRLSTLAAVSEHLAEATSLDEILTSVTAITTPAVADWSVAALIPDDNARSQASISSRDTRVHERLETELADPDSHLRKLLVNVRSADNGDAPVDDASATGQVCEEIETSLVAAPIQIDGQVIGALVFGVEGPDRTFDGADCRFIHDLARRVSATIANTRLVTAVQDELRERSRAEIAFRESEGRFRDLANAGNVMIRQEDERGHAMYFNQPWLSFTGKPLGAHQGTHWLESIHPGDREAVLAAIEYGHSTRETLTVEYRLRRFDGEYCWMIERGAPRFSDRGEFTGMISSIIDITDRKRAESNLQLLASTGTVVTSSLNLDEMLIRFVNHATESFADWCVIHLFREGQLVPSAIATSHPGDRAKLTEIANRSVLAFNRAGVTRELLHSQQPVLVASEAAARFADLLPANGVDELVESAEVLSWVMTPLEARGRIIGSLLFVTAGANRRMDDVDLSMARSLGRRVAVVVENAQLFAEAQAAEERYRRFFAGSADAILVIDQSQTVREVNPALLHLLGSRTEQVVGQPFSMFLHMPGETLEEMLRHAAAGEWRGELSLIRSDGSPVFVEAWLSGLVVPEGPIIVAAIRDISERHQFEESRRRLLATVSHDLKNPLNSIKANAQLAQRQIKRGNIDPAKITGIFARIDGLTNRMVAQIEDLMDVSLLESGSRLELDLSEVDLVAMTRLVVDQYQATTNLHRILVRATEERVVGNWDAHRMERVLTNLLTNAIKYSPNGGDIVFTVSRTQNGDERPWALLSLSDKGIGIQADDLPHLFTRFGRGRNVTERISGTGIGLVGVSQIVQQHGGTIDVDSVEGRGSTFIIRLPLSAPEEEPRDG